MRDVNKKAQVFLLELFYLNPVLPGVSWMTFNLDILRTSGLDVDKYDEIVQVSCSRVFKATCPTSTHYQDALPVSGALCRCHDSYYVKKQKSPWIPKD